MTEKNISSFKISVSSIKIMHNEINNNRNTFVIGLRFFLSSYNPIIKNTIAETKNEKYPLK